MTWWWLPLAAVAYGIFAINGVVDKLVVTNKLKNPLVVSFWVSLFGVPSALILILGVLPFPWAANFRFMMPPADALMLITAAGITLQLALLLSYMALWHGEATRVVPVIGAATPACALIFAYLILGERLPVASFLAFGFLLAGAVLIAWRPGRTLGMWFWLALASGAASAFEAVLIKLVYGYNQFISSLALLGLGNIIICCVLVLGVPAVRRELSRALHPHSTRKAAKKMARLVNAGGFWVFANNLLGSLGVIILNLSLKLGPVSLVNALKGLQYIGVLIIALMLRDWRPRLLNEELGTGTMRQKLTAIALIGLGVGLLVVSAQ
jgi:uncharacterized membrane protein